MLSLTINIKNKRLQEKVLETLKRFEKEGLEIISKEDYADYKLLLETRDEESVFFED